MPRVFYSKSHPKSSDSNDALALQTSMYTRCVQGAYKMRTRTKINSLPLLMCKREKDLSLLMCATCLSLNGYGRSTKILDWPLARHTVNNSLWVKTVPGNVVKY